MSTPSKGMAKTLIAWQHAWQRASHADDDEARDERLALLRGLKDVVLPSKGAALHKLVTLHDALLFRIAHAVGAHEYRAAESALSTLLSHLKALPEASKEALQNEGLAHCPSVTRFSHDALRQLLAHPHLKVTFDGFREPTLDLNAVLRHTLPSAEVGLTTAGLDNAGLLAELGVAEADTVPFLVQQLAALDDQPYLKDHLFDALEAYVRLTPTHRAFSRAHNRIPVEAIFTHDASLKRFDHVELLNRPLAGAKTLSASERADLVRVLKSTMSLTVRETDPSTHMAEDQLALYPLERGLAVALFGMVPARQLPLESYIGFTLFKNGLPAAYGGAWLYGARGKYGINIFEPYRGGESGYVMCQIMRVYRQVFGIDTFEVEPYQYGADNPDGIASGAYWFYYKFGFRSVDAELAKLAEAERARMAKTPGYRSPEKTLLRFTESNIEMNMGDASPPSPADAMTAITQWIAKSHHGDRAAAVAAALATLQAKSGLKALPSDASHRRILQEWALWAAVQPSVPASMWKRLPELAALQMTDPVAHQRLLRTLLSAASVSSTARA